MARDENIFSFAVQVVFVFIYIRSALMSDKSSLQCTPSKVFEREALLAVMRLSF